VESLVNGSPFPTLASDQGRRGAPKMGQGVLDVPLASALDFYPQWRILRANLGIGCFGKVPMARMSNPLRLLCLLLLMCCSGCASGRSHTRDNTTYSSNGSYNENAPWIAQMLSDASANNWNFDSARW
jgi:hypothetical protein